MKPARVLVADPPWRAKDKLPGKTRGAARNYPTLSVAEICAFPLPPMEPNALLFLWRVSWMQEEALQVVRAWGFVPKSEVVWLKRTKHGKRHFGMGRYVRAEHETAILATRGRFKADVRNVRSTFEAPTPTRPSGCALHSAKPDAFYELVEGLATGPYAELFSRRVRPRWRQWGNELPGGEAAPVGKDGT